MNIGQELYKLKITSAVVIEGIIRKAGEIVELAEREARDLLRREKAVPHDEPAAAPPPAADAVTAPTRAELDAALAALPGEYTDADYVVNGMRAHFGELFTADDEAKVRELVKTADSATDAAPQEQADAAPASDADAGTVAPTRSRKK